MLLGMTVWIPGCLLIVSADCTLQYSQENHVLSLCILQETEAASMTDMERKNLRRAMYSRDAARTEEDEEGERLQEKAAC